METYAIHKRAMITPFKAKQTLDLIRGKNLTEARGILINTNTKASRLILKVLNSAGANAINNQSAKEADLVVSECYVSPGRILKRIRYASKGNIDRHDKRTSHIVIKVSDNQIQKEGA